MSPEFDALTKIVDTAPDAGSVTVNFRGEGRAGYDGSARYSIPFFTVQSGLFTKTEFQLNPMGGRFNDLPECRMPGTSSSCLLLADSPVLTGPHAVIRGRYP